MIAVATLVLASKMHGRTLSAKQLVAPGATVFSAQDVQKTEFLICDALKWELTPVTPYEIMKHIMLFSAAPGRTFKNLVLHAQLFIDFALCEYKMLEISQTAVALSAVLHAHKAAKHCPKQWLEAIQEANLYPICNKEVHACCYAMAHVYDPSGIGIPSAPMPEGMTESPTSVSRFLPTMPAPPGASFYSLILPKQVAQQRAAAAAAPAPVKFHCAPRAQDPTVLKRPRVLNAGKSSVGPTYG
jgi:hypothetical protein